MKAIRKDPSDFTMVTRGYWADLRALSKRMPAAFQALTLITERMNKSNTLVISQATLGQMPAQAMAQPQFRETGDEPVGDEQHGQQGQAYRRNPSHQGMVQLLPQETHQSTEGEVGAQSPEAELSKHPRAGGEHGPAPRTGEGE